MTDAKEKTEWQGLQPDLYNIPQGFDKVAALSASKREFESGAQSSGDKVEHKILDFVDTDYILADSDEAALDTLYEAENNRYRARVAELYGTFQKAESELNSDIAKKSAQEQEQRATLDAMTQKKESARAVRDNVDAVLSAYPESMQKDVRTALEKGGKLPEPKALKDKIKVLWNKRKINKSKRNVDEFLQSVQDDAAKGCRSENAGKTSCSAGRIQITNEKGSKTLYFKNGDEGKRIMSLSRSSSREKYYGR